MKNETIQKTLESLNKGGIIVNGDLVLEKHVENEIGNVESGGIGFQIIKGKETAFTNSDKDIKAAIAELMVTKDDNGKYLFVNKKQWWAVYKVLMTYCDYPSHMTAFVKKMKELGLAEVDGKRDLSYDSLSAASKDLSLMAKSSPDTWEGVRDINDHYKQQYVVADFLMKKLGIMR